MPCEEDPTREGSPVAVPGMADDAPGDYVVLMVSSRNHQEIAAG